MSTSEAEVIYCLLVPLHDIETNSSLQGWWWVFTLNEPFAGGVRTSKGGSSYHVSLLRVAALLTPCIRSSREEMDVTWQKGVLRDPAF